MPPIIQNLCFVIVGVARHLMRLRAALYFAPIIQNTNFVSAEARARPCARNYLAADGARLIGRAQAPGECACGSWQMQAQSAASAGWRCGKERVAGNLHQNSRELRWERLRRFRKRGLTAFARPRRKSLRWVVPMEFMNTKRSARPLTGGEANAANVSCLRSFCIPSVLPMQNGKRSAHGAASIQIPRRLNFFESMG